MTRRVFILGAGAGLLPGLSAVLAQGHYGSVKEADVLSMRLNHYLTPDKKGHMADFDWLFFKDGFVVKRGEGPIPKDLLDRLAPGLTHVDEIKGKWRLSRKSGALELFDVRIGKSAGRSHSFPIHQTAPTVIRVGNPQYVFGLR